jgi:multidrug efflux pump subunit AcrA (membrane-fusion protein)
MKKQISSFFLKYWNFFKELGVRQKWGAAILLLIIIGGITYVFLTSNGKNNEDVLSDKLPTVELIPVSDYGKNTGNQTNTLGSETVVQAEASGKIVSAVSVGTRVSPGTTIARFENSAQQATLLQAEGSLEAAKASFEKTQGGPRSEKIAVLQSAFNNAQSGAVATLLSSYASIDSAIRDTADQVFSNSEGNAPQLTFTSSNSQRRIELVNERVMLGEILNRQSTVSSSVSTNSDLILELSKTEEELRQVRVFIDTLITSLNEAIPTNGVSSSDIASYKSAATAARTALTSSLSSIASARTGLETTEKNLEEALVGAEDTELAASSAAVKQAQGVYDAAEAAYAKTIVRSPTSGTVVSCNASVGDVLSIGNDVCRIKTSAVATGESFSLPLSSVKYTPLGSFVFVVSADGILETIEVTTGLVTADSITVTGLSGDEFVIRDVRGLKAGEKVNF